MKVAVCLGATDLLYICALGLVVMDGELNAEVDIVAALAVELTVEL